MYKLIVSVKKSDGSLATFGVVCGRETDRENVVENLKEDYRDVKVEFFGECFEHDYSYDEVMNEYKIAG
ncbi:MAG: hypothetical protein HZA37_01215 [Parcubacteria group bacterium]|nr:hypothetical protein [Parcubacteria group bacterium]